MIHVVLYEPEIPQNTGNIMRTCAAAGATLHLIEPLGFSVDDKQLKRAGLDHWHDVEVYYLPNLEHFLAFVGDRPIHLISNFPIKTYSEINYADGEDHFFIFGKETTGLPEDFMRDNAEKCLRSPMNDEHVRSLNLSNTACMIVYEALRQQGFPNLELTHHYENDKLD